MRTSIVSLAFAACASSALAQQTQVSFEGSYDQGQTWTGGTMLARPGDTLLIRARVALVNAGSNTVLGIAGITFQPKLTNFVPSQGDVVLPFTSSNGVGVAEEPQTNLGRILPFASSGMGSTSASGVLTSHLDPDNSLRFAGANAITATTNLAWGVGSGQLPPAIAGTNFRSGTDAVVFRYAVQLNSVAANSSWTATVDLGAIIQQRASYYVSYAGLRSYLVPVTQDTIVPLHIVVPAPGVMAVLTLALVGVRRRCAVVSSTIVCSSHGGV